MTERIGSEGRSTAVHRRGPSARHRHRRSSRHGLDGGAPARGFGSRFPGSGPCTGSSGSASWWAWPLMSAGSCSRSSVTTEPLSWWPTCCIRSGSHSGPVSSWGCSSRSGRRPNGASSSSGSMPTRQRGAKGPSRKRPGVGRRRSADGEVAAICLGQTSNSVAASRPLVRATDLDRPCASAPRLGNLHQTRTGHSGSPLGPGGATPLRARLASGEPMRCRSRPPPLVWRLVAVLGRDCHHERDNHQAARARSGAGWPGSGRPASWQTLATRSPPCCLTSSPPPSALRPRPRPHRRRVGRTGCDPTPGRRGHRRRPTAPPRPRPPPAAPPPPSPPSLIGAATVSSAGWPDCGGSTPTRRWPLPPAAAPPGRHPAEAAQRAASPTGSPRSGATTSRSCSAWWATPPAWPRRAPGPGHARATDLVGGYKAWEPLAFGHGRVRTLTGSAVLGHLVGP